ncbi:MAG: hypothetical protein PHV39_07540 [Methanomicrobium sp.]|nr:hypothetical protein [Methanomicrobium sp.]
MAINESLVGEPGGIKDDGTFFFADSSISAIKDKNWNFHGIHGSFIDITAEKESRDSEVEAIRQIEKNLLRLAALNDEIINPLA